MSLELRDYFAIRFAARLAGGLYATDTIVRRAYDLADAMIAERARRIDEAEQLAIAGEAPLSARAGLSPIRYGLPLLDELPPPSEAEPAYYYGRADDEDGVDPRWLEPPIDPSWDVDPRWGEPSPAAAATRESARPGLARTEPEAPVAPKRERSA